MNRTYTPQQMAKIVTDFERLAEAHRLSQQRYYERNSAHRKEYAASYYAKNKERILNQMAAKRALPTPDLPAPAE